MAGALTVFRNPKVSAVLAFLLAFFTVLDGWQWVRSVGAILRFAFKKPSKTIYDTSEIDSRVMTTDLDWLLHMNNSKYPRELDYGRIDFWGNNGIYKKMRAKGMFFVLGAINLRFRRELNLFQKFRIVTRLLCWDDEAFYLEQRFVGERGFVHAIAVAKQTVVSNSKAVQASVPAVLKLAGLADAVSPPVPEDVARWMDAVSISSAALRKEAGLGKKE